jgi:aryl-alcohol dehydrogenase-like predicted oxidoreductase
MVEPVWTGCISASDPQSHAWLEKNQIPLFAWSSQAQGFFTDRSAPDVNEDPLFARAWYSKDNFTRKERVIELARQFKVDPIAIALAYVLQQPFPTFPLIGPRTLEETRSSMAALEIQLTKQQIRWLNLETDRP